MDTAPIDIVDHPIQTTPVKQDIETDSEPVADAEPVPQGGTDETDMDDKGTDVDGDHAADSDVDTDTEEPEPVAEVDEGTGNEHGNAGQAHTGQPAQLGWVGRQLRDIFEVRSRARQRKNEELRERARLQGAIEQGNARSSVTAKSYLMKRAVIQIAYLVSIGFSGYGQTRYFADWMGLDLSSPGAIARAAIGAVFLELTMIGSDGYSMYQRQQTPHHGWKLLRLVGWLTAFAGAALNYAHFGQQTGVMFALATIAGFALQDIAGHLQVRAVLEQRGQIVRRQKIGLARWIIHKRDAYRVWTSITTDPSRDVDDEFRRVLALSAVDHNTSTAHTPSTSNTSSGGGAKAANKSATSGKRQAGKNVRPRPTDETLREFIEAYPEAGARAIATRLEKKGYTAPSTSTIAKHKKAIHPDHT